jgi:transmembrane sensor
MSDLMALGQQVAHLQDEVRACAGTSEAARRSFIRALRRRATRPRLYLLVAGVVGAFGIGTVLLFARSHPISVMVGGTAPAVGLGASVSAPSDREVPLRFSDGSVIALAPGSEAAIASLEHKGGTLDIRRGLAHVQIVHNADTHWALQAGPYTVNVTGTRFDIEWRPEMQRLRVDLFQGSIVVSGRNHESTTRLSAGQQLLVTNDQWSVHDSHDTDKDAPPSEGDVPVPADSALTMVHEDSDAARLSSPTGVAATTLPSSNNWALFAARGDYRSAYDAAEHDGFESVCRRSTSAQLLSLAEASRFTGHADRAESALRILRKRFAKTHDAALAAFQLGRIAGGGQASAQWFRTYLREQKGGELAREASGRLLEALWQAGDQEGARVEAQSYLRTYPQGPHAAFAQRLQAPPNR